MPVILSSVEPAKRLDHGCWYKILFYSIFLVSCFRCQVSGFRFQCSVFRFQCSGFSVQGSDSKITKQEFSFFATKSLKDMTLPEIQEMVECL